jgi:hypothetical protein
MKIEGYSGICRICFEPVKDGSEYRVHPAGMTFHTKCAEEKPNSYYLRLEQRRAKREKVK